MNTSQYQAQGGNQIGSSILLSASADENATGTPGKEELSRIPVPWPTIWREPQMTSQQLK